MTCKECKDCLHYEVCPLGAAVNGSTGACLAFKNKADLVEVVRCHKCKLSSTAFNPFEEKLVVFCAIARGPVPADHFCGFGERREASG